MESSSISSKPAVLHPGVVYNTLAGKGLIGEHRSLGGLGWSKNKLRIVGNYVVR